MNDTNRMSLNIESKASLIINNKKNDLESIDTSNTNRIGTDTTLWDILQNDENIVLFFSICGFIYQSNPKKSFFRNTSSKHGMYF